MKRKAKRWWVWWPGSKGGWGRYMAFDPPYARYGALREIASLRQLVDPPRCIALPDDKRPRGKR